MREIGSYEAKTHLPEILRDVERGEIYVITRRGRPVARLIPAGSEAPEKVHGVIENIREKRKSLPKMTTDELLASIREGMF